MHKQIAWVVYIGFLGGVKTGHFDFCNFEETEKCRNAETAAVEMIIDVDWILNVPLRPHV